MEEELKLLVQELNKERDARAIAERELDAIREVNDPEFCARCWMA